MTKNINIFRCFVYKIIIYSIIIYYQCINNIYMMILKGQYIYICIFIYLISNIVKYGSTLIVMFKLNLKFKHLLLNLKILLFLTIFNSHFVIYSPITKL